MAIDLHWMPRAEDYLRDIDSYPRGDGDRKRWHCPFCDDHSLRISRADRITCDNGCVDSVSVVDLEAWRWDCTAGQAARQLGCWIYEGQTGCAAES